MGEKYSYKKKLISFLQEVPLIFFVFDILSYFPWRS